MQKIISLKYQNTTVDFLFYKYNNENKSNDSLEFHKHLNYEIHFACSGCYEYKFIDKSIMLSKNEMLIIPPGKLHKTIEPYNENYKFIVLTLKFSSDGSDHFYDYFHSIFEQNSLKCLKVPEDVIDSVFRFNYDIDIAKNNCLQNIYLVSRASDILYSLCSVMTEDKEKWQVFDSKKNLEVKIENLVNANMSITDIANKINYSTRQTERLIKMIYGKSLSEIRRNLP